MLILDFLKRIFNYSFPIWLIAMVVLSFKRNSLKKDKSQAINEAKKSQKEPLTQWEKIIYTLFGIIVIVLFLAIICFVFAEFSRFKWVLFALAIPVYLQYLAGVCLAIGTLGSVVNSKDNKRLSVKENFAIQTVAYIVWVLSGMNLDESLINWVKLNFDGAVLDAYMALIFVGCFFVYIFLILSLIYIPLFCGIKFVDIIIVRIPFRNALQRMGEYFVSNINSEKKQKLLLIKAIKRIMEHKGILKIGMCVLIPVALIIDIARAFVLSLFTFLLASFGYIVILFRAIKNSTRALSLWLINLSDKRIIAISFRLALIFAFVSVVVLNRYQPIFCEYEKSTAVFEFLASSIVIPIVFEWIYSVRNASDT